MVCAAWLQGCSIKETVQKKGIDDKVQIPMILIVDSTTGNKNNLELVEAFNKQYAGKYELDVEWIMETEEEYRHNLKRQNVTDQLPAIITEIRLLPSFYRLLVKDGRIEDLSPYMEEDKEWSGMIEDIVLEQCSEPNGKIYLAPLSTAAFSCSGIFWNEELFQKAGIETFPQTWKEFWECCDRLKEHEITPLALHTEGTAWAPMLLATAQLADTDKGMEFMQQHYPKSYLNQNGLRLAKTLKRLFHYTTEDALHNDFDVSHQHFFSGEAAMLPNGYWMIEQIPEEWKEKVRFAPFPGNKLISSPETFGWAVVSNYSEEIKKGAIEFLKFRTKMNQEEKERLFSMKPDDLNRAEQDYINAYQSHPQIVPNYQVKWNSVLQEEILGDYLPQLAKGIITEKEFVRLINESIQ